MDEQDRLDELFAAPGGAGYASASRQESHPCCLDDDESDEELASTGL
jgi:hypothetical protein